MGRRRNSRTPRRGLTRRNFLRGAGGAGLLLAAQPFLTAGAQDRDVSFAPAAAGAGVFVHGVASGDPLADRVILWTRVTLAAPPAKIPVDYVVATDTALANVVAAGSTVATSARDYTVKLDVTGLSPNTTYYYRFSAAGAQSPIGRTKTLPVGSIDRLRIGVVSCASLAHGYFNAYRRLGRRADLDLVVHLGDYIYEYGNGEYGSLRNYQPPTEIVTLLDYRLRHNQYKTDPDLQSLHRQHPMVAIWDDHEFADNAWSGGAGNHQPDTEGSWTSRVSAAVQAYHEWMPIRPYGSDPRRIYRSFRLGDLAELYLLEERVLARSEQLPGNVAGSNTLFTEDGAYLDASRLMMPGAEQSWLVKGLRGSTAQWKLIGQGVMMAPARVGVTFDGDNVFFNSDQWDGYKPARDSLLKALKGGGTASQVKNAVILTGDIHSSWAADLPLDPYGSSYDENTGAGSLAAEFIAPSVTSPGLNDVNGYSADGIRTINPHLKYVELERHGYVLLDITTDRVSSEWWYVDTITTHSGGDTFATAMQTVRDSCSVQPGAQSSTRGRAPPLAP